MHASGSTILFLILLIFLSCRKNPVKIDEPIEEPIVPEFTSQDTLEAQGFALWLSRQLTAPESLVIQELNNLHAIRKKYPDSSIVGSIVKARFLVPWVAGEVLVLLDSTTKAQISSGQYSGWDSLNSAIRPDSIQVTSYGAYIKTSKPYNAWRLVDAYRILPGARGATVNGIMFAGGTFPIFSNPRAQERNYLFPANSGLGAYGPKYIFLIHNGEPQFIGAPDSCDDPRYPEWCNDFWFNIDSLHNWGKYLDN